MYIRRIIVGIVLLLIILALVVSLLKCKTTEKNIKTEHEQTEEIIDKNAWNFSEYLFWAKANNRVGKDEIVLPRYFKDKRTGLCFVLYKNFGFEKVSCNSIKNVIE